MLDDDRPVPCTVCVRACGADALRSEDAALVLADVLEDAAEVLADVLADAALVLADATLVPADVLEDVLEDAALVPCRCPALVLADTS